MRAPDRTEDPRALLGSDGGNPLPRQFLDSSQPCPCRGQTIPTNRSSGSGNAGVPRASLHSPRHPLIGHGIVRFPLQAGARDNRAESDQQAQARRIRGLQHIAQPLHFGCDGPESGFVETGQQTRLVVSSAMQDRRSPAQAILDFVECGRDGGGICDIRGDVEDMHAGRPHPFEVRGQCPSTAGSDRPSNASLTPVAGPR